MGVGASADVNWSYPPPVGRDYWGVTPTGLQPSQHQWSQLYLDGIPPFKSALKPHTYAFNGNPKRVTFGIGGQGSDLLQTFGANIATLTDGGGSYYIDQYQGYFPSGPMYPGANTRQWPPPQGDPNVCTPENYPNCNMQIWRDMNDKQPTPYAQYWAQTFTTDQDGNNIQIVNAPTTSQPVDLPKRWEGALNNITQNYLSGGLDALDSVNSKNTSGFDPCQGSGFFEVMLPLFTGAAAVILPNVFGFEIFTLLPKDVKAITDLTLAVVGYDVGKIAYLGTDTRADRYKEKAATAITVGGGVLGGELLIQNVFTDVGVATRYAVLAGTAFLSNRLLYDPVLLLIQPGSLGLTFAGFIFKIFDSISNFFCHLTNWGYSACDDFKNFPDARKWDVASISAQITDRIAAKEGWGKDDPRREFVFRGLITGPAMLGAAAETPVPGIFATNPVNPIGSWLQVHTRLDHTSAFNTASNTYVENVMTGDYTSITGNASEQGWWGTQEAHNRYACNNLEVLLKGIEETQDNGEQETTPQQDDDRVLATRLNPDGLVDPTKGIINWAQQLTAMARDPNNIRKQGEIPGMQGAKSPKFDYDSDVYLATCMNDFEHKAGEHYGTGFNHVSERGKYAAGYATELPKSFKDVSTQKEALLMANWCFGSSATETEAIDYLESRGVLESNIALIVQYWHQPKGDAQRWTFDNHWRSKTDPRVQHYLAKEVATFKFPFTRSSSKLLPTPTHLKPAQHTHTHGLDPAQHTHSVHLLPTHMKPNPPPQFDSSKLLLQILELELGTQGWQAVKTKFDNIGSAYPTDFEKDGYFYVTYCYYLVAMESKTPDAALDAALAMAPTKELQCAFAQALFHAAPMFWQQLDSSGQSFIKSFAYNNCSK